MAQHLPASQQPQPGAQHQPPTAAKSQHTLTWRAGGASGSSAAAGSPRSRGSHDSGAPEKAASQSQPVQGAAVLPGVALYYTEHLQGVPHTLSKLVRFLLRGSWRDDDLIMQCTACSP